MGEDDSQCLVWRDGMAQWAAMRTVPEFSAFPPPFPRAPIPEVQCAGCRAAMAPKAVICIQCGFDRRTGKLLETIREKSPSPDSLEGQLTTITADQFRALTRIILVAKPGELPKSPSGEALPTFFAQREASKHILEVTNVLLWALRNGVGDSGNISSILWAVPNFSMLPALLQLFREQRLSSLQIGEGILKLAGLTHDADKLPCLSPEEQQAQLRRSDQLLPPLLEIFRAVPRTLFDKYGTITEHTSRTDQRIAAEFVRLPNGLTWLKGTCPPQELERILLLAYQGEGNARPEVTGELAALGGLLGIGHLLFVAASQPQSDPSSVQARTALRAAGKKARIRLQQALLEAAMDFPPPMAIKMQRECMAILRECLTILKVNRAMELAKIGDLKSLDELLAQLDRIQGGRDQEKAAFALGCLGDRKAVKPLITALLGRKDWGLRAAAAHALGMLGDPAAEDALIRATNDVAPSVRTSAENALEVLRRKTKAIPPALAPPIPLEPTVESTAKEGGISRCRYWVCAGCSGLVEKKDLGEKLLLLGGVGATITGSHTCARCKTQHLSNDIYSGRYDLPRQHWERIARELGKPVEVDAS